MEKVKVKYIEGAKPISIEENGDWVDLRSRVTVEMKAGEYHRIPLGVAMELPIGFEGHVLPRSGTYEKWGITMVNSEGIIDNSYRGEWQFAAKADRDTIIYAGDRICQFRIERKQSIMLLEVDELSETSRGDGGFGSTGVK